MSTLSRQFLTAHLSLALAMLFASPLQAQTMDPGTAGPIIKNNPGQECFNLWALPGCYCGSQPGGSITGPPGNPDAGPMQGDFDSPTLSFIPFYSLNYHHFVNDYWPGQPSGGCSTCAGGGASFGGSELAKLFIQRRHRYRDVTMHSSFGPGVFCNYDVSVTFQPIEVMIANPSNPSQQIPAYAYRAEVFDPVQIAPSILSDGVDGDTLDGVYSDTQGNWVKDFRCLDVNGNLVTSPNVAASAVLTNWPGKQYKFDLFNLALPPGPSDALGWWKFDEGTGQTANDSSGNGNTGTLVNSPAWTAGESGAALSFNGQPKYVDAGNPGDLNFQGNITLACWVNLALPPGGQQAVMYASGEILSHGLIQGQQQQMSSNSAVGICFSMGQLFAGAQRPMNPQNPGQPTKSGVGYSLNTYEDFGYWMHWAATYDGTNWNLYRNGLPVASAAGAFGAVNVTNDWYIGAGFDPTMGWQYLNGAVDDVRIYNRALTAYEVAGLAQQAMMSGRLASITDRNGYAVNVTHKSFTTQQLAQSPDLQWQVDTVSDPYGRQATFSYLPTQVSGEWAVNQITLPNAHKVLYNYANGQLASVAFDDGTTSTFTYGFDANSGASTVEFFDVAADGPHRVKTVYLTNNFTVYPQTDFKAMIVNQSSQLPRMIVNGAGEVCWMAYYNNLTYFAYEGSGRLKSLNHSQNNYAQFALPGWVPAQMPNNVTWENLNHCSAMYTNASIPVRVTQWIDPQGHQFEYTYDTNNFLVEKQWAFDGTTELYSYNQFKQVTRHQDRNLNVTLNTYDAQGNLLSKEVGIKNVSGVDTHQPEYAKYQWTYYPAGDANQFLLESAIDANGNSTVYNYDASHRLTSVVEPPDAPGDAQATTTISYDAASRVQQILDPLNRAVVYDYDERDRVSKITYGDSSTERFIYGSPGSGNENLLVRQKDRNGATTRFDYDAAGRLSTTTYAYSTMDLADNETLITDPSVTVTKTCTYLNGTELVASCTERGETTTYGYDYRQRLVSTTVQPRVGVQLTSTRTYVNNILFSESDPFGRIKYFAYRSSDGRLIREIQGTVPSFTLADFNAVINQTRDATPNAKFLITDYQLDNIGQRVAIIDGNNITLAQTFDSRGQLAQTVEASGTPIAATTGFLYDANGNLIEERTPRYYDSSDPQVGNCRTQMTYTGRNLLATRTEAPGTSVAATVQYLYNLDRTRAKLIDARNNTWQTLWSACCAGRKTAEMDPLAGTQTTDYDSSGNVTFVQVVQGTTTYNQTTTRFDARHRPIFRTVWLTTAPAVDPNNPPIAGQNGVPTASGLTTQWYYDENVADDVGLSSAAGENIAGVGNVSIRTLLAEVQSDGVSFGGGSDGYAILEVRPDGELAVTILDAVRRTVAQGLIQPPAAQTPNAPITWLTRFDDTVVTVASLGNLVETAYIDALGNADRRRTDGTGRTLQMVDAESNIRTMTFDASSNQVSLTDPNSVGYSAVFDARNRETSRTDTTNAQTQMLFDANSNVIKAVDARNASTTAVFDARDRRVSLTDRVGGTTSWGLDANSNVISSTDSESNTTQFTYDPRNLKTAETYVDNAPPSVNDQVTLAYDGARRLQTRTDQQGDYVTTIYDMASRPVAREYRDHTKQPSDPPNDAGGM